MHLLLADSQDATADILVDALGDHVVRVNNDRPGDHEILIRADGFSVADAFGRRVTNASLRTLIVRKLAPRPVDAGDEALYAFRELTRALEGLVDQVAWFNPEKLPMDPHVMGRVSKFTMCQVARDYFPVPAWAFTTHPLESGIRQPVLKNLSGMPFSGGLEPGSATKMVFVQKVEPGELAQGWPWYIQESVEARHDVTVAFIDGQCFAMRLDRSTFEGADWRRHIGTDVDKGWEHFTLSPGTQGRIADYMRRMGLRYGRLDFLSQAAPHDDLIFLEVNPYGQWAWMDLGRDKGVHDAMVRFLTTPTAPRSA